MTTDDAAFIAEMTAYLTERGYRVTKARAVRNLTPTAARKLRKAHPIEHRGRSVDGCPVCAFRADVRAHAAHAVRDGTCRFCIYEERPRLYPSTLRRMPDEERYRRAYAVWRRARSRYGAGHVRASYGGRVEIVGHPRVAHLQALLDRLAQPSASEEVARQVA